MYSFINNMMLAQNFFFGGGGGWGGGGGLEFPPLTTALKARIASQMSEFNFILGLMLGN